MPSLWLAQHLENRCTSQSKIMSLVVSLIALIVLASIRYCTKSALELDDLDLEYGSEGPVFYELVHFVDENILFPIGENVVSVCSHHLGAIICLLLFVRFRSILYDYFLHFLAEFGLENFAEVCGWSFFDLRYSSR